MGSILKFIIIVAGCTALYGIATGQDLNVLFETVIKEAKPVAQEIIVGAYTLFKEAIGH
jgi:hypothetical protein